MHFLWPHNFWWMLALPLLPAVYLWLLRRRDKQAVRLSSLIVVRAAAGRSWRRHVPPALVLVALSLLALALTRPTAPLALPWSKSTILLAMDISRSMRVQDVKPTRMVAAQEAAKAFLSEVPRQIQVGLVTFAGTAQVAQQPTIDRPSVIGAIDAIQMQYGTATRRTSTMMKATCHCGAVSISIPRAPAAVTNCNCSVCSRYGTLWACYDPSEVEIIAAPKSFDRYQRGAKSLAFVRCHTCGCVTHWEPIAGLRDAARMGVNVRLFEPAALGPFKIRFLDGAVSEDFVGEWSPPADSP